MESREAIIKGLRCSATVMTEEKEKKECPNCPYRVLEEVKPIDGIEIVMPCLEIDGKKYWSSCDVDRINIDAADYIEQLKP